VTARIIFAGTPDFAAEPLKALLAQTDGRIVAVYTQPDRPAGRGQKPKASPVKELAAAYGLPVYQPRSLRQTDAIAEFRTLASDLMIVVAYGLILPPEVLAIPRLGCVNIHASLLPRWRGAAPIQRALQAGDLETGITLMQMDAGLDTGEILMQARCEILPADTAQMLHDRLAALGARCIVDALGDLLERRLHPVPQDESGATYAAKIERMEARLDWHKPADELARQVRAFNPKPVAYGQVLDLELRIWNAVALADPRPAEPGEPISDGKHLDIGTGRGLLRITQLQLAGKRPISASDFLNAHPGFARRR
jgi:methionyl-tRNA formyltransferase